MDTSNSFFPMDLSGMPMQTDQGNELSNMNEAPAQQQGQATRTNAFGQNVFMGVSDLQQI
jgi:hypothetical protein